MEWIILADARHIFSGRVLNAETGVAHPAFQRLQNDTTLPNGEFPYALFCLAHSLLQKTPQRLWQRRGLAIYYCWAISTITSTVIVSATPPRREPLIGVTLAASMPAATRCLLYTSPSPRDRQ